MDADVAWLRAVLADLYGAPGVTLRLLASAGDKRVYRVEHPGRPPWVARIAVAGSPDVFGADAAVLAYLERQAYAAPRVVPAGSGAAVSVQDGYAVFVTDFIDGESLSDSPADLTALGDLVGHLHALPNPTDAGGRPLRPAGMLPRSELAYALGRLAAVRNRIAGEQRRRYDELETACHGLEYGEHLPPVLLHNDCHPGNSLRTPGGQVVLIDWEGAGPGPAVIDLGFLLVSSAIPLPSGWDTDAVRLPWSPPPLDGERVCAVVDGYRRRRLPTPAELDALPDAIRFRSLVAATAAFARQVERGRDADAGPWWRARYAAAEQLAAWARQRVERGA